MGKLIEEIIIAVLVLFFGWFFIFRPSEHYDFLTDCRDIWFTGTAVQEVYVDDYGPYYLDVSWDGKEKNADKDAKWIHYFTIYFRNGGYLDDVEATCDKAASITGHKRVCEGEYIDEYGDSHNVVIFPIES